MNSADKPKLLPFQSDGVAYALRCFARGVGCLLGDEMGLGKTVQAIKVIDAASIRSVLIVCPKSLVLNWDREIGIWLGCRLTVGLAMSGGEWPEADIVLVTYDMVRKFPQAAAREWDLIILDEAQLVKDPKTERARSIFGGRAVNRKKRDGTAVSKIGRSALRSLFRLALTGTPIQNRPIELWPIVHWLAPAVFRDWKNFAFRYCAAKLQTYWITTNGRRTQSTFLDTSGASNLPELNSLLRRTCMIRRLKAAVLAELPPKRRQLIELDSSGVQSLLKLEDEANADGEWLHTYRDSVDTLDKDKVIFREIAKAAHDLAYLKVPAVTDHVADLLDAGEKVILFAHHLDAIAAYSRAFPGAPVVVGDTSVADRQAAVDKFQADDSCRLIIGGIIPMGVGITLTAARVVVFAEQLWTPGLMDQAEDRAHRHGQRDSVLIQYLVFNRSLDANRCKLLIQKGDVIKQAVG